MNDIKDIRYELISEIMHIDNMDTLNSLYSVIENNRETSLTKGPLRLEDAIIELKKAPSLDEIVNDQDVNPITYQEITDIVDSIDWEVSLSEMLNSID